MATSQTLDRGLTALNRIATADHPPTIDGLAAELGVHRSIAYRIVRTLEEHRLVHRDPQGRCRPASALVALAAKARSPLQDAAAALLPRLADDTALTAFLVVREGDEAVTVESAAPTGPLVGVTYRPGSRHQIDQGAPGLAILAGGPAVFGERVEVADARHRGWATSDSEVIPGLRSIAAPVPAHDAAIAVVALAAAELDTDAVAEHVTATAAALAQSVDAPLALQGDR
ncbi:MAG: helix-turn-helix domain-containing protein [Actinomycetota bacterium]